VAASDGDSDDGSESRPLPRGFRALSQLQALRGAPPRVHTAMLHLDRASAFAGAYLKAQPWARLAAVGYLAVLHLMLLACSHGGARHSADVRGVGSG